MERKVLIDEIIDFSIAYRIFKNSVDVEKIKKINPDFSNLNWQNLASYKAMFLDDWTRKELDLFFLEGHDDYFAR